MNSQKKHEEDESLNTDINNTLTNAEEQDNSNFSKIDEKWEGLLEVFSESPDQDIYYVKNTPFGILHRKGEYIVMCGNNQVSEKPLYTLEDAYKDATEITWSKITMYVGIMKRLEKQLLQTEVSES